MIDLSLRPDILVLIAAAALLTFATRIGGHLLIARFSRLHPRLEAALEAVPAAVITAIVVPPAVQGGAAELMALAAAAVAGIRFGPLIVILLGLAVLIAARAGGL